MSCDACAEEIINEREIRCESLTLCQACAGQSYYRIGFVEPKRVTRAALAELVARKPERPQF
jgi:hypothetical protein